MVYGAESGQAGLKKATALKPDIILLAICILDMSGLEVIEALSADSVTQRIPVIGIIDGDLSHIESETLKRNRNLISLEKKPIDLTKLLEMVEIGPTTRIEPEGWEGA